MLPRATLPSYICSSLFAASIALLLPAPAVGSVDRSPGPGGIYRLKPGVYVTNGVSCANPPATAVRRYDGRALPKLGAQACRARLLSRKEYTYATLQSCGRAGTASPRRSEERQVVEVGDALHFRLRTTAGTIAFRYCPTYQLPPALRRLAP